MVSTSSAEIQDISVSIIIPCFNEEETIASTIDSIIYMGEQINFPYEIILVDNKSDDDSAEIARDMGAKVVFCAADTVSGVRNEGAYWATGRVLLFLDSDVILDKSWAKRFCQVVTMVINERVVVGSHCAVPPNLEGIFKEWYLRIQEDTRDTHIGTGHMLVSRKLFYQLGQFDPTLASGEDYDFCKKAMSEGCRLIVDKNLIAYHMGYPTKIKDFIKRELWHGEGDVYNLKRFLSSKVAISAVIFGVLHILVILSLIVSIELFLLLMFLLVLFCLSIIYYKFRVWSPYSLIKLLPAMYLYLAGRLSAILSRLLLKSKTS